MTSIKSQLLELGINAPTIKCHYCNNPAKLVTCKEIYPHRKDLFKLNFYQCLPCEAYVGTHKGTTNPLGILANSELRAAKSKAHKAFDELWRDGYISSRSVAYKWLSEELKINSNECHIGMFSVEQCDKVVSIVNNYWNTKFND